MGATSPVHTHRDSSQASNRETQAYPKCASCSKAICGTGVLCSCLNQAPYQVECLSSVVEACLLPPHLWPQVLEAILLHVQQLEQLLSILQEGCFSRSVPVTVQGSGRVEPWLWEKATVGFSFQNADPSDQS